MIAVTMPAMIIGLIPIIIIEAYVINSHLSLGMKLSFKYSSIANLVTTLIGIPVTWTILFAIEVGAFFGASLILPATTQEPAGLAIFFTKFLSVTVGAPWLAPSGNHIEWMVPTAMLFLLVPFFFISWKIEYMVIKKMDKKLNATDINTTLLKANLITYTLLTLYPIGLYLYIL